MILYVSWGGTGRAASLRQAMRQAVAEDEADGPGLRYLAILDNEHFADLDAVMLAIVHDELRWLLDAQLELTRKQVGADALPVEVVVRRGDVVETVVDVLGERGQAKVVIGAPVVVDGHDTVEGLRTALSERINAPVQIVMPVEEIDGA